MSNILRSRRGSILIEAAFAFPVLVLILLSMAEFGEAFTIKRRNVQVAGTAADLVAQVSCVMTSDLTDVAKIGATILAPYSYSASIAGLSVTAVMQNASNATVEWSWSTGTLSAGTAGTAFSLPSGLVSSGQEVIVAETSYKFVPTFGSFLTGGVTFTAQAFNKPRLGATVALQTTCSPDQL